jgi:AraC family transcriptional regulator of adaptative response/methylated-DNA-[protein]-cysteine methyltransferase
MAQPGAARAVGSAVGANPLAFIIPCHRVIRETGVLGNYQWDPIRKRAMIGWEISSLSPFRAKAAPMLQADAA